MGGMYELSRGVYELSREEIKKRSEELLKLMGLTKRAKDHGLGPPGAIPG